MKRQILAAAAAVAMGVFGSVTQGGSVSAVFNSTQPLSLGINATDPIDGSAANGTFAGVWQFTIDSVGLNASDAALGLASGTTAFQGVCIDFSHTIGFGTDHTWTVKNLTQVGSSGGGGNGVGILTQQAYAVAALYDAYIPLTPPQLASPTQAQIDLAVTLQLAVWDVLYDKAYNGAVLHDIQNSFTGSGGATEQALITADAANAKQQASNAMAASYSGSPDVYALVDTNTQNFAIVGPPNLIPNVPGTPLPRSAYAGLSLLAVVAGLELTKKRKDGKLRAV